MILSACSTKVIYKTKVVRPPAEYNTPTKAPEAVYGTTYKDYILELKGSLDKCNEKGVLEEEWFDNLQTRAEEK
jgi:hypothetical protein